MIIFQFFKSYVIKNESIIFRAMKNLFFLVFVVVSFIFNTIAYSQLYKNIENVQSYSQEMDEIDAFLKLNPYTSIGLIDDLERTAKQDKNNELQVICDIYRGTYYYYTGNNDSSLVFLEKAIQESKRIRNHQLNSSASIRKLFVIDEGVESGIMFDLMEEEYFIALENKDTLNMIYALNGLGSYSSDIDSNQRSFQYYIDAIELSILSKNEFEHGFILNNFGLLKLKLDSPKEAFQDLEAGMEIAKKLGNIRLELILRDNYGYYYSLIDSVDLAQEQYEYALRVAKERNYPQIELTSMINLSSIARMKGNIEESDSLILVSLDIAKKKHVYHYISYIYLGQASLLLNLKKYDEIEQVLDSVAYYSKYGSRGEIMKTYYGIKYDLNKQKGDFESALKYYIKRSNLSDSLDEKTHMQVMTQIQLKYDVEKKEIQRVKEKLSYEENLKVKEEEETRMKQWFIIIVFSFLLILSIGFIYYFINKNKQEAKFSTAIMNQLEEERERIAKDLHDGIGQNLIIIKNKYNNLKLKNTPEYEELNENLSSTLEDVRNISRSLIPPELKRLGLRKSIDKMLNEIEKSTGLIVSSDLDLLDDLNLSKLHEIRIYRIIQELSTNTIKHSKASSLRVEFVKKSNGFGIIYQDNGIGLNEDSIQENNSIGLRSIRSRLKMLNGTIKFEKQEKGLKAIIRIKTY